MEQNKASNEAQNKKQLLLEQYEVKKWLEGKNEGAKRVYLSALTAYIEFTNLTPEELIDEAEKDRQKSTRQRGEPEHKTTTFFQWLTTDYIQKQQGRGNKRSKHKKQLSSNLACTYSHAIKGFYRQNNFPLNVKLPKAVKKKENFKLALRIPEIRKLIEVVTSIRDKAIILTLFQSGISINELCNLTYGDVRNGLQNNEKPLYLHIIRQKENVEYETFLGTDAIEAIKSYLAQRVRDEEILDDDSPLFRIEFTTRKNGNKIKKIYPLLIECFMRRAAFEAGLVSKEKLKSADMNPARPHALRTAFISILKLANMNNTLVEYFCGHSISPTEKAYMNFDVEELRKNYKQFEKYLSINAIVDNQKIEELENKSKTFEQESKSNQGIIQALMQNSNYKDAQINNMNGQLISVSTLLSQVQDSLTKLNGDMDFHKLEDIARFVASKAPTREELTNFLTKRQINDNIFRRPELSCIAFSPQTNTWVYIPDNDSANLLTA
jgi:integrase